MSENRRMEIYSSISYQTKGSAAKPKNKQLNIYWIT